MQERLFKICKGQLAQKSSLIYSKSFFLLPVVVTLVIADPSNFAAILPLTLLLDTLLTDVRANAVLFAGLPCSDVFAAIGPDEGSVALALIVDELAAVHLAVLPLELTLAVHFVLAPVAGV